MGVKIGIMKVMAMVMVMLLPRENADVCSCWYKERPLKFRLINMQHFFLGGGGVVCDNMNYEG